MYLIQRKIENVFNRDTGKDEVASLIFNKIADKDDYVKLRRDLHIRNKEKNFLYICSECGTELELSCIPDGKNGHTFYFKHIRDPKFINCSIKTDSQYSKEDILRKQYLFKSESNIHVLLKQKVGEVIKRFIDQDVIIDRKFIKDKYGDEEKRKPDIFFKFNDQEITIEFQVNNTFHSVIQDREAFYERNKISLIWVFREFCPESFQSISIKDIYIPNGNNAFVFDDDAERASYSNQTLCLNVFYKIYCIENDSVGFNWVNEIISFDQIKFNPHSLRPYYFDCGANRIEIENELIKKRLQLEIEEFKSKSIAKAKKIKEFLTKFKENDNIDPRRYKVEINELSEYEVESFNNELCLNGVFKDGNNLLQLLLVNKSKHHGLIVFLLGTCKIKLLVQSINSNNETTLISVLKSLTHPEYILELLFSRGYKLNDIDKQYITSQYEIREQKKRLYLFTSYEKLKTFSKIEYFHNNLNEYLVIESAKRKELTIIGDKSKNLIWMANMAADSYKSYWYYYDKAFAFYDLNDTLNKLDTKGTFKRKLEILQLTVHSKNTEFEQCLEILYPELF